MIRLYAVKLYPVPASVPVGAAWAVPLSTFLITSRMKENNVLMEVAVCVR